MYSLVPPCIHQALPVWENIHNWEEKNKQNIVYSQKLQYAPSG